MRAHAFPHTKTNDNNLEDEQWKANPRGPESVLQSVLLRYWDWLRPAQSQGRSLEMANGSPEALTHH
jgi:hypothetical protein